MSRAHRTNTRPGWTEILVTKPLTAYQGGPIWVRSVPGGSRGPARRLGPASPDLDDPEPALGLVKLPDQRRHGPGLRLVPVRSPDHDRVGRPAKRRLEPRLGAG